MAWKASKLTNTGSTASSDEIIESLRKQRDYLVEQLADFVIGGQFNTTNSVKRTVRDLYINLPLVAKPMSKFPGISITSHPTYSLCSRSKFSESNPHDGPCLENE